MSNLDVLYKNINGQPVPFIIEKRKTKVKGEPVKAKKKGGKKKCTTSHLNLQIVT